MSYVLLILSVAALGMMTRALARRDPFLAPLVGAITFLAILSAAAYQQATSVTGPAGPAGPAYLAGTLFVFAGMWGFFAGVAVFPRARNAYRAARAWRAEKAVS